MVIDEQNPPPGLDEQYIAATVASDLTLRAHRRGAADHLIAAGLVGNRMGAVLKHLRAEWDLAAKPAPWTDADVTERAEIVLTKKGKPDMSRARAQIIMEYATGMQQAYMRLPTRMDALAIMADWAHRRSWDPDLLSPALYHHLAPTCPVCHGLKQLRRDDAPVLGKQCYYCAGEGTRAKPLESHRVLNWLKSCEGAERGERRAVLHEEFTADEWKEMRERRLAGPVTPDDSPEDTARIAAAFRLG